MTENNTSEARQKGRVTYRFFVVLSILMVPVLIWVLLNFFSTQRCKPLMMLKKMTETSDSVAHTLPEFQLMDQSGKVFTQESLKGKYHVANFIFTTCPSICLDLSDQFQNLQEEIKKTDKVILVSISVDPENDTIQALQNYAKKYGADEKYWKFLTGEKSTIIDLVTKGYMQPYAELPSGEMKITHSNFAVLIDKDLRIRGFYDLVDKLKADAEAKRLIDEINVLDCEYRNQ